MGVKTYPPENNGTSPIGLFLGLAFWTITIFICVGCINSDRYEEQRKISEYNKEVIKFAKDNDYKVRIIHMNDTLLPNGKWAPIQAVHCVTEGINTKERKLFIVRTGDTRVPIPNEVWKVAVVYDFIGTAYQTKEVPGRARIVLDTKAE